MQVFIRDLETTFALNSMEQENHPKITKGGQLDHTEEQVRIDLSR